MTGEVATTEAAASIFVLASALKINNPGQSSQINQLLGGQSIVGSTIDDYGSSEVNNAGSSNVLPVYTPIVIGGPSVQIGVTGTFGVSSRNKLGNRRLLRMVVPPSGQTVSITASGPAGSDPDIRIITRGVQIANCNVESTTTQQCPVTLGAGITVIELLDYNLPNGGTRTLSVTVN